MSESIKVGNHPSRSGPQQISGVMGAFSILTLLVSVVYAALMLFSVPTLGLTLDDKWRVTATTTCQPNEWWCDALNPTLRMGTRVLAIGDVDYEAFSNNPTRYVFAGLSPGDQTTIEVDRNGQVATLPWRLPPLSARDRLARVSEMLLFVPFFVAGTVLLLMLRPRGVRSRVLVSSFYVLALWLSSSGLADTQAAFSSLVERMTAWLLVPLLWHLHLLIPGPITRRSFERGLFVMYVVAAAIGGVEAAGILPIDFGATTLILASAGVVTIFIIKRLRRRTTISRQPGRLMVMAFVATMLPLIITRSGWTRMDLSQSQMALLMLSSLTTPIMPFTYLYVIHRRWVNGMRLGFHRQLAQYSFMLVYLTMFIILSSMGVRLIESPDLRIIFNLILALLFIAAAPASHDWFKRGFVFLAVGAKHEVDEVSHYLASRLPQVVSFDELGILLGETVLPGLLIRQSALVLMDNGDCTVVYHQGEVDIRPLRSQENLEKLLTDQRHYRPPGLGVPEVDDWVRLVIPLQLEQRNLGVWLFGERDPDDYYSQEDISLISVLASQVMLAVNNMRRQGQTLRQTHELSTLYELLLASTATLDRRELLDTVYQRLVDLVSPDKFIVAQTIPDRRACKVVYAVDNDRPLETIEGRILPFEELERVGRVIEAGRLLKEDVPVDKENQAAAGSWMGIPMISQGSVIGILYLESNRSYAFGALNQRLIEAIAGQLAITLSNVQLYEEATRRALEQEAVNRIVAAASRVADVPELLNIALDRLMLALGIGQGVIWLEDPEITFVRGFEDQVILQEVLEGIKLIRPGGESSVVENWLEVPASIDPWANSRKKGQAPIGASLSVPLLAEGHVLGGLALVSAGPRRWDAHEIHLSAIIGRQIGGAIERLNLLDQIRQQADQMQGILETMGEGLMTLTHDHEVALANSVAREYLELLSDYEPGSRVAHLGEVPIEQVVSRSWESLPFEIVVDGNPPRVFEIQSNRSLDSTLYGEWTLLIREVTEVRRAQSQSQLHERLAAVGQIAAGIAHDFNNIVASILLFSEMLLAEPDLTDRGRDRLAAINHQAQQAANLTRQILDFGRQTGVDLKPVDLIPILREETDLLRRTVPANIQLVFQSSLLECFVSANPGQIGQLLLNLVLNARDALPDGGEIRVDLSEYQVAPHQRPPIEGMPSGTWIRMTVGDNGQGIPPNILDRIFEPFFTTKAPGDGTGLGLAQVYGIVQQHSGFIDVSSHPESGTEFKIFLPILKMGTSELVQTSIAVSPSGSGEKILVVEDQEGIREAVCQVLEKLNYNVSSVHNGLAAQKFLEQNQFDVDLVLSDVVMPEMGGMALNRWLLETAPEIKLILMSGYPLGDGTRELLDPERVRLLHKPMDTKTLAFAIDEMLALWGKEAGDQR